MPSQFDAWNPGITSRIPDELRHLCTLFRPEHVTTSVATALEISDLFGLEATEIVAIRPARLALHEILIRVTAEISVPDGERIQDLGINFRRMTRALLERHIEPRMAPITATYDRVQRTVAAAVERELARLVPASVPAASIAPAVAKAGLFARLAHSRARGPAAAQAQAQAADDSSTRTAALVADWETRSQASADPVDATVTRVLARVVAALLIKHGSIWAARTMIASVASAMAVNELASDAIGRLMDAWLAAAADSEGYRMLPAQQQPVVMNLKGPSAAGKSTIRPLQKALAGRIGVTWSEFALISPDIWRKLLLDYGSLGSAYKYGGAFTGDELRIVDQKLDRYMAQKAQRGQVSHLLIDRFRFDSFAPDSNEAGSNLLTRFGQIVYLFFVLAPPAALVERAWNRGLAVGRYKAVDDTLAHSVEAYGGIPQLFFTWIQRSDKKVHFEFLDNSVLQGEVPRTVAFGWNDVLNVLDIKGLLDIERFRKVNIDATSPVQLFGNQALLAPERNTAFLRACVDTFRDCNFCHQRTGRIYLRLLRGAVVWADAAPLAEALADADTRAGLQLVAPSALQGTHAAPQAPVYLERAELLKTVGRWGSDD